MSGSDDLARQRAEMDQSAEGLKDLARGLAGFYQQLVSEEVPASAALSLTQSFLIEQTRGANSASALEPLLNEMMKRFGGEDAA